MISFEEKIKILFKMYSLLWFLCWNIDISIMFSLMVWEFGRMRRFGRMKVVRDGGECGWRDGREGWIRRRSRRMYRLGMVSVVYMCICMWIYVDGFSNGCYEFGWEFGWLNYIYCCYYCCFFRVYVNLFYY